MPWISGEAATMWQNAVSPDVSVRKSALKYWARHRDVLPGPLFFTLSSTELLRGEWQRVVKESEPHCSCGARRWFIPAHSQRFYESDEPTLITLGAGRPQLAIAPWGGDARAAMVQLSVDNNHLVERLMPYAPLTQDQLRAIGHGTLEDIQRAVDGSLVGKASGTRELRTTFAHIAAQLNNPPLPVEGMLLTGNGAFSYRSFGVFGVNEAEGTVTVGVSKNFQRVSPADRGVMHICA